MWKSVTETENYFAVRPECEDDVRKSRFKPRAGKTLSARKWHSTFSVEGHLDIAKVLGRIQRGGVHPSIKGVVWEFLLGCYDPNSTFDERSQLRQERREQYADWRAECQKMVSTIGSGKIITSPIITDDGQPIQDEGSDSQGQTLTETNNAPEDKKVIQWKLLLHQIGLDVVRTDRALVFYEDPENDAKLWNILSVYAWRDDDVGYCQGMNDICSPMVILLENEADAYWCFSRLMRRLRENFRCTTSSIGVQSQLDSLASIIKALDPKLHQHLENLDGGEYLFAFRMLMVLFRREFSFLDAMYLWELMWAMEYNPNIFSLYEELHANMEASTVKNDKLLKQYGKFERKNVQTSGGGTDQQAGLSIFLIASVLENKNKKLMKEAKGLDDVVKIMNDITGTMDAKKACNEALKLHKKYLKQASIWL
ncbi:rab GTPase-activating protein 22-like isoform X1 [Aristolochia californica]|uniref:rab GTPase-activating protein 22-like isoform X1 n=1 Tax=Aristolochia californica TaxID=171875 RepID=UPI0035D56ECD